MNTGRPPYKQAHLRGCTATLWDDGMMLINTSPKNLQMEEAVSTAVKLYKINELDMDLQEYLDKMFGYSDLVQNRF